MFRSKHRKWENKKIVESLWQGRVKTYREKRPAVKGLTLYFVSGLTYFISYGLLLLLSLLNMMFSLVVLWKMIPQWNTCIGVRCTVQIKTIQSAIKCTTLFVSFCCCCWKLKKKIPSAKWGSEKHFVSAYNLELMTALSAQIIYYGALHYASRGHAVGRYITLGCLKI